MADDWSMGEVVRRLDRFEGMLREFGLKVVSQDVYNTEQRLWENRFTEMQRDLQEEQEARKADVKELKEQLKERATQRSMDWRQVVYNGLIPAILVVVGILYQALRGPSN